MVTLLNKYIATSAMLQIKNISTCNVECALCIKNIASEQGEQHATGIIQKYHKIQAQGSEIDTAELPSYYTKRQIHRNYCQNKDQQAKTNARGDYEILK